MRAIDRSEPPIPVRGDPPQPPAAPAQPDLPLVRPRLRGVFHQYGFFAALLAGTVLVIGAPTVTAGVAAHFAAITLAVLAA